MTREELKAEALIDLGSEPAPKEWENIPCIKEQRPPIMGFEASLQRFTGTDICTWFICVGGLWQPHSDYFQVSLPPAEGAEEILHKYVHTINSDGTSLVTFMGALKAMREFAAQQQPTAEGAEETAQRCPVCGGNGLVPNGFYNQTSGYWSTSSISPETCRTCNGTGVILPSYLHAQQIADKMVSERLRDEIDKYLSYVESKSEETFDRGWIDEYFKNVKR